MQTEFKFYLLFNFLNSQSFFAAFGLKKQILLLTI